MGQAPLHSSHLGVEAQTIFKSLRFDITKVRFQKSSKMQLLSRKSLSRRFHSAHFSTHSNVHLPPSGVLRSKCLAINSGERAFRQFKIAFRVIYLRRDCIVSCTLTFSSIGNESGDRSRDNFCLVLLRCARETFPMINIDDSQIGDAQILTNVQTQPSTLHSRLHFVASYVIGGWKKATTSGSAHESEAENFFHSKAIQFTFECWGSESQRKKFRAPSPNGLVVENVFEATRERENPRSA